MVFNKNKKAISKAMAMGILTTSLVPVVALNENVEAKEVTSRSQKEKTTKVVEVTCYALNVRKGPSKDNSIA
ncbi:peptidoglycan endopeptidase, partial [Clostridium perfringens]|nr:peptidoglycan endopeptidase [Clostridium perfringens]